MSAYQGLQTSQSGILIPRMKEGYLGTYTFPRTNASGSFETMKLPLRAEKSLFTWTMMKLADVSTSPNAIFFQLKGSLVYVYSGVEFLQNIMLLSQNKCHGWFQDLNSHFYNFVESAGTFAAPTATDVLSIGYKYTISQMKQTTMEVMPTVILTDTEYNELNDGTFGASYAVGTVDGTGGSNGLIALVSQTGASRPGFKSITVNGVSIGEIHTDTELTFESAMQVPGNKGRAYARGTKVTLKAVSSQMNPANVRGAIDHTQHPGTYQVVCNDYNDNAWTFVTGMKPDITDKHGDEVGLLEINMMTEYPYDFTNAINFASLTTPTFTQLGLF